MSNDVHLRLSFCKSDMRFEESDGHQPMILAFGIPGTSRINGLPEVDCFSVERSEARRHNSHNRGNNAGNANGWGSPQDVWVAVKMTFPERVANHDGLGKILHLVGNENSAEDWLSAKKTEEVGSHILHVNGLGSVDTGESGGFGAAGEGDVFKDVVLLLPVQQLSDGRRLPLVRMRGRYFPDGYDAVGVRIRKRTIQQGVQDAEDGGVCAYAKSQGE